MNILVVNAGSSSLKYQLIDTATEGVLAKGVCERIGQDNAVLKHRKSGSDEVIFDNKMPTHREAIEFVLKALVSEEYGAIKSMSEIGAVGHRVLHAGEDFTGSVRITPESLKLIEKNADLGPLHMPANIMGIKACLEVMPKTPMVAVFDTAFHSTMPAYAYMYGIKYDDYKDYKVKKYGFHGTSHQFVSGEAAKYLKKNIKDLKIITCHLGNGSSIAAVDGGKCVDTSMGFTPLEGLPMGTRCGNIDSAAIEFLMNKKGWDIHRMLTYLNKECGMLGISGVGSDFRDLTKGANAGNTRCKLALDMFSYEVKKYIGSYAAAMGGVDVIVFTAGVGENTPSVREDVSSGLEYMGVLFDKEKNSVKQDGIYEISAAKSKVKVLVVPTNEELVIARETLDIIK